MRLPFNIRLNKHRNDSKNKNPILTCKHLQNSNNNFQRDAKFTLTEQRTKIFTNTEESWLLLKKPENFWILKLQTLDPEPSLTKKLIKFKSSFTVIFRSKLGIHTFITGSRNITIATIELLKNVINMSSRFPIVNLIHKYQQIYKFFCPKFLFIL